MNGGQGVMEVSEGLKRDISRLVPFKALCIFT